MAANATATMAHARPAPAQWLTRALFPRVMEFKVISREREKHEFMPVVYLLDRSPSWRRRVPRAVEQQLIEDYISPLLPVRQHDREDETAVGFSRDELQLVGDAFRRRTELLKQAATHEVAYKMAVLVNYAPKPTLHKSELFQVVRQLLTTLGGATHRRALLVPVSLHFCTDGGLLHTTRHAGIRYGSPVLVEKRDVEIFQEDPLEYVHHVSAKLQAALKMPPPQTAAQMEIIRLSRSLHVYCARVYRDDCFSRRQIASMNEEILQIHFRTRNHPDMHVLKTKMQQYCQQLRKWRLRDEDINAATIAKATPPEHPVQITSVVAAVLLRLGAAPWRLLLSGLGDLVFRAPTQPQRKLVELAAWSVALLKCAVAFALGVVLCWLVLFSGRHWLSAAFVLLILGLHSAPSSSVAGDVVATNWKKIQFYIMDAAELRELTELRAVLARRIHALVAQYVSADLPPPVLQSPSKGGGRAPSRRESQETTEDEEEDDARSQYSLNPHHKIFINAPRSFPLDFAEDVEDDSTARRAVYAPKMLRDEVWRNIYGSLAPLHLQFAVLLADNRGDSLPMERLLATPFFDAVLTAYVLHQKSRARSASDVSGSDDSSSWLDEMVTESGASDKLPTEETEKELGSFASVKEIVEAALELAEEEEELSS